MTFDDEMFPPNGRLTQGAEANRSGQFGEQLFEGALRAFNIEIIDDDPGYHGAQLFPRSDRLVIRQPSIDFESRVKRADYLYKDYRSNTSVLIEIR